MITLNNDLINQTLEKARSSERKRAIYCFHKQDEILQRMLNCALNETYVRPHKHENSDKLELFTIIKGKAGVLFFDDNGKIKEKTIIDENGPVYSVEIPARTWHSFVVLSKEAVLFELILGKYDPDMHKKLAAWAPKENTEESKQYLNKLKKEFENG